jgi:hypothetical protein
MGWFPASFLGAQGTAEEVLEPATAHRVCHRRRRLGRRDRACGLCVDVDLVVQFTDQSLASIRGEVKFSSSSGDEVAVASIALWCARRRTRTLSGIGTTWLGLTRFPAHP